MSSVAERTLAVWPLLIAEIVIFGTTTFTLLITRNPECQPRRFAMALAPLWRGLAIIAIVFSPLVLLVDTASMADTSVIKAIPFVAEVVRDTHFGRLWLCEFGVIIALVAAAWTPGYHRARTIALCALAWILLLLTSLTSHAIDRGPRAVAVYLIHEMAAALWIGAILGLWLGAARGRLDADWIKHMSPRVSSIAAWTVLALVLSGFYTAYFALSADLGRLIYAAYGRTLLVKVGAAIIVILIGGYNRFFLIPTIVKSSSRAALLRNVGVESLLLVGILGLAALLANTPPAH